MDDLISRRAAIDAMMKLQTEDIEAYGASIPEGFDGDRAVTALKALPSAQQWIPCEERLPEEEKAYLVTFANEKVGMSSWHKDTFNRGFNRGFDVYLIGVTEDGECEYFGVVAWMEKPEPWKGEDNG